MTLPVPSLKQLAAQVVVALRRPRTTLPDELVVYLKEFVDLEHVVAEQVGIQEDCDRWCTQITTAEDEDLTVGFLKDMLQEARDLLARVEAVLPHIGSALNYIDKYITLENDQEWKEYYSRECTQAISVLEDVKQHCEMFIGEFEMWEQGVD